LEETTRLIRELVINVVREYNNLVLSIKTPIEQTIFQEEFNRLIFENVSRLQTRLWNSTGNETYLHKFKRRIEEVKEKIIKFKENTESIKSKCEEISKNVYFELEKNNDIYERNQLVEQLKKKRHKASSFINEKAKEILELIMLSYKFIENVEDSEVFKGFKSYIEEIAEKGFYDAVEKALVNSITSMHRAMLGYKNANPSPFLKIYIQMAESKNKKETIGTYEFNPSYPDLKNLIMDTLKDMQSQALNCPDIIKMFVEANENFIKKLEKKKLDDKMNRPMINSINNLIGEIKEIETKPEKPNDRKNLKGGKVSNQGSAPTAGKNVKINDKKNANKDQDNNQSLNKQDNLNDTKDKQNSLFSMFGQGERVIKFPKADEAKRSFTNDLKEKGLEKEFNKKLQTWKDCQTIKDYAKILEEEESERFINDKFEKFLIEPNSQIKDLTLALKENINKPSEFKTDLSAVDNENTIPETIVISFFLQFDATPIKHRLIDMCENIVTFNLQYVMEKTKKELVIKVEDDIKEHTKDFEKEPETKEDYKIMLDKHAKCVEDMPLLFKKIDAAKELVTQIVAVNLNKGPNDDLIERVNSLEKKKDVYELLLEDTEKMLKRAKDKLANQVLKQFTTFKQKVEDLKKEFLSDVPDKIEGSIREEIEETNKAQSKLELYFKECKSLKEEEEIVKKGLTLFKDDLNIIIEGNKDLLEIEEQIKSLFKIWDLKRQMNQIVYEWCHTQFYDFVLDSMSDDRQRIENELLTKCKELKNRQLYTHMKDQLEVYGNVIEVLRLLRDEAMNSISHWEKLSGDIKEGDLNPYSIDFNFEKILELKLEMHKEKILERVDYAREQQKVDRGLERIKAEWKKNEFKFEFKGEHFKLLSNEKMISDLEEHLTKVAEYKSTPFYEDFREKIDNMENELNRISDNFTLLKQVLEKWNYLKNVFSKDIDDMTQQAGVEKANFESNNKKLIIIFESFKRLLTVKECFLQKNIEKDLKQLYLEFSGVEKGLRSLIETKRNNFERLYFLSNDDFLELLGNGEDTKIVNYHLSKLFSGIEKIEISEPKKLIEYVYDSYLEKLKLKESVQVTNVIETWLKDLEKYTIGTLEQEFSNIFLRKNNSNDRFGDFTLNKNDDMDKKLADENYNGQILLTMTQYLWRKRIENEMIEISKTEKTDKSEKQEINWDMHITRLKDLLTGIVAFLEEDSKKGNISKKNRVILYNYILIIKHHYDLTLFLKQQKIRSSDSYDWLKLLKINIGAQRKKVTNNKKNTKVNEELHLVTIEQLNNVSNYGYEYIGNKERLVLTTLTERCFLTMMTALFYHRGGSLQGPAGTGKTETVKDLSRNLAKYIIVFNCSNKNNYNTMSTIFMGILKTGAWCCFDEFNRIEVEVLSVIRIQLTIIYDGLRANAKYIQFKSTYLDLNKNLAIFITMNPTYIFRSELPDNLKTLFRPISLMHADRQRICEIRFHAEGYNSSPLLAQKLVTTFDVMEQQLSKQAHYDFSLRTMIAILLHAGAIKNSVIANDEHALLKIAIGDMIRPKLVSDDEEIFEAIINSIFLEGKHDERGDQMDRDENLRKEIKEEIEISRKNYTGSPYLVNQIILIQNYLKIKHGIMLVGDSLSGKTTAIKILQSLSKRLAKKDQKEFTDIHITTIYPKSVELDDLYGKTYISSLGETTYVEGLLPYHIKDLCNLIKDEKSRLVKWLCLDGPVDSLWIESMNTLLDETKMLSLPSGYRINLKQDVKIIFETENLVQATPATVSRVGLIFFEADKLSWFPIARNWLDKRKNDKNWYELIAKWFDKYVYGILNELKEIKLIYLINTHENQIIISFIKIFESFLDEIKTAGSDANNEESADKYWEFAERLFIFSLMWAIGGALDEQQRIVLDSIIRKYSPNFPPHSLIFDYMVNPDKEEWGTWEEKMISFSASSNMPFNEIFIPTLDITRNKTIIQNLIKNDNNPLIIGGVCTGKSSIVKMIFKSLDYIKYQFITVNLSYGIKPKSLQEEIEYYFEKRNNKLFPPSNKKCLCYIEDLNLPRKDQFGCQIINEMLRQCIELEGWYSTENLTLVNIRSLLMFASTCLRGSDRSDISKRYASKFVPITLMTPNDYTKSKIFNTVLSFYLSNFPNEDIKKLSDGLTQSMIGLYNSILEKDAYLPTPMKCHYIFNLRDVSKIFEAISKVKGPFYTREYFIKLWVHECFRTLHDRFLFEDDKNLFRDLISKQIEVNLGITLKDCQIKENRDSIFVDFIAESYEEVNDFEELKKAILTKIEGNKLYSHMVFFDQAINYICFLNRILNKNIGGHGLLIGTGASGRTSSIKIACELSNFRILQINAAKELKLKEWKEFIKQILKESGSQGQKTSLIIQENDIISDEIFEDLNYIMQCGMIPNILNEDWEQMKQESANQNVQNMSMESFISTFKKYCCENLKVFINLSPLGEKLKSYTRIYPSIIDYSTAIKFIDWPESALIEVSKFHLNFETENSEDDSDIKLDIAEILSKMHLSVFNVLEKMNHETKRKAYFTSSNFVQLIKTFNKYLSFKKKIIKVNIEKYNLGIQKIKVGKEKIDVMSYHMEEKNKEETTKLKELEKIIDEINEKKKIAMEQENDLEYEREKNAKNRKFFEKNMEESKKELDEAEKPMKEAHDLIVKNIDRKKLAEFRVLSEVPSEIKNVFYALMAVFNRPQTWDSVRSYLQDISLEDLVKIENLPVTEKGNFAKIQSYTKEFNLEKLQRMNQIVPNLAQYIILVEKFFKAKWNAEIKRKNLDEANKQLGQALQILMDLEAKLNEIKFAIEKLEQEKRDRESALDKIKEETGKIKTKLERANFLINAFKNEEGRWAESLLKNQENLKNLTGNTILAAGILTYFGVFSGKYRDDLLKNYWIPILNKKEIQISEKFEFLEFISNSREIQDWVMQGLPNDNTFKENAVIIKYSLNFALIIDPQDQALIWIKNMQKSANDEKKMLKQFTPQTNNYLKSIQECINRDTVIINNIGERLGMDLEDFIKGLNKDKNRLYLMTKVPNPHFYPEVSSVLNVINFLVNEKGLEEQLLSVVVEIEKEDTEAKIRQSIDSIFHSSKALDKSEETILQYLNDAGDNYLEEDQLINELKRLKDAAVKSAEELRIVRLNLDKIEVSREEYRPLARKVSKIFFVLYSMNNINNMYEFSLHSYKELFKNSIKESREKITSSESSDERIKSIEKVHITKIISFTNQSLFENHRLLFSLQLCLAMITSEEEEFKKELEKNNANKAAQTTSNNRGGDDKDQENNSSSKVTMPDMFNQTEFSMLIQTNFDHIDARSFHKPSWINDENAWKFIINLENKIPDFKAIISSFTHNNTDWYKWYISKDIEKAALLPDWEQKCKGMKSVRRLLLIKALRPDKFSTVLKGYIHNNLGIDLRDTPINLKEILIKEVNCYTPLLIIHGNGIDPSESLQKLWEAEEKKEQENKEKNAKDQQNQTNTFKDEKDKKSEKKFYISTLNQDQLILALTDLTEQAKIGGWVYFANTHLTLQSIPQLEKTLDDLKDVHKDFRLIISTNPHPKYPISFLQRCEKITFEMPKGIGTNMARILDDLQKDNPKFENYERVEKNDFKFSSFSKLVYSLCMFHAVLIERRKFKSYGWTCFYDFNNSDFKICFDILKSYMSKFTSSGENFPWKALQELIVINYGSRFTNEKDLALLNTYATAFFNQKVISEKVYNFSSVEPPYLLPDDSLYERFKNSVSSDPAYANKSEFFLRTNFYKEEAKKLPKEDPPELFGLHFNAEISSQIEDNLLLIENIRLLSPDLIANGIGATPKEEIIIGKIQTALGKMPNYLNTELAKKKILITTADKQLKFDPTQYSLFLEASRYNNLLRTIKSDLTTIESALRGNTVLSPEIEEMIHQLYEDKFPVNWLMVYLSTKKFTTYINDLVNRIEFFNKWITNGFTTSYFIGYFTNPNGFITSIKQKYSLDNKVSFNRVSIDFKVNNEDDDVKATTKNGFIIKGLFIQGGIWDKKISVVKDENIQDLNTHMPLIIMTPMIASDHENLANQVISQNQLLAGGALVMQSGPIKHWFPVYYIPIRGDYLGKNSYVMDIPLNVFKDKDKEGQEKTEKEYISYWIKKGSCLLMSKND